MAGGVHGGGHVWWGLHGGEACMVGGQAWW